MKEERYNSIDELNREMHRRMDLIPEPENRNCLDGGQTGYEEIRDWYIVHKIKLLNKK